MTAWQTDVPIPPPAQRIPRHPQVKALRDMPVGASIFVEMSPDEVRTLIATARYGRSTIRFRQRKLQENGVNGYRIWKVESDERPRNDPRGAEGEARTH